MDEVNKHPMVHLVELLETGERIEWDTVEELVGDVPGWLRVVQMLRDPARQVGGRYTGQSATPESGFTVSRSTQTRLHEIFLPYAILLDTRFTPVERALRLKRETGRDPVKFGQECLQFQIPAVVEAARAIQAAAVSEETLLRGSIAPSSAPQELLRTAGPGDISAESLLHASETPPAPVPAAKSPRWLQRLFSGRKA